MRNHLFKLAVLCGVFAITTQAHALPINPFSGTLNLTRWQGPENSQSAIDTAIAGIIGSTLFVYDAEVPKNDGDPVTENGSLAGSYETTFFNTPTDPAGALIEYVGGPILGPTAYLLVKDGKATDIGWYLFNLTSLGWGGTENLELSDFWPAQGAISHVSLYGTPVPEPGTLLLLGSGLIGLASFGRKRFKR